jgi:hypothetical protein
MHGFKRYLIVAVALACGVAALTGSALAAPPSEPPGQAKKDPGPAPAQPPPPAAQAPAPAAPASPGQDKKSDKPANGVNSTTEGVKPSNNTKKNTKTTAGAKPDVSKRYGNGKTAAQIAKSRGAPDSTEIRGPGNSQPHKVCRNGHWVDVHAVKSYSDNTCAGKSKTSSPSATSTPTSMTPQTSTPAALGQTPATSSAAATPAAGAPAAAGTPAAGSSAAGSSPAGSSAPSGGVLGAEHTSGTGSTGGVAGAFAEIGGVAAGSLPFTGFPLWAAVVIGLAAVALGWMLWRRSRPATTTDAV